VFHVRGMTCALCVRTIENALRRFQGVKSVKADLKSGYVVVISEKDLNTQNVIKAIVQSGKPLHSFEVTLLNTLEK